MKGFVDKGLAFVQAGLKKTAALASPVHYTVCTPGLSLNNVFWFRAITN